MILLKFLASFLLFSLIAWLSYRRGYNAAWGEANTRLNVIKFKLDECYDAYRELENRICEMEGLND